MTNICVTVKDGKAEAKLTGVLTAGMVGVPVTFLFGPEWQDLSITTVFKGSAKTIDRVLEGRARYIPGGFNRFLSVLGKLVPPGLVAAAVHWRWRSAQKKWLNG